MRDYLQALECDICSHELVLSPWMCVTCMCISYGQCILNVNACTNNILCSVCEYRRLGNFHVAFFFCIRTFCTFNFRCLSNWRKIVNGKNFPVYGIYNKIVKNIVAVITI